MRILLLLCLVFPIVAGCQEHRAIQSSPHEESPVEIVNNEDTPWRLTPIVTLDPAWEVTQARAATTLHEATQAVLARLALPDVERQRAEFEESGQLELFWWFGVGGWIRNSWLYSTDAPLRKWFLENENCAEWPDEEEMSAIVLRAVRKSLAGEPVEWEYPYGNPDSCSHRIKRNLKMHALESDLLERADDIRGRTQEATP